MSGRTLPGRILALSPGDMPEGSAAELLRRARAAVDAGLDSILLREPGMSDRATLELLRSLRDVLGPDGWLGIHDRVHLAQAGNADGVHLGFRSIPIPAARAVLGGEVAIGFSAHAHDAPGAWSGADYLVFGPVFATPSKAGLLEPLGIEGLARGVRSTAIPIWALGGITHAEASAVVRTGCRGCAVRAAILGQTDPAPAYARLRDVLP
ncbi:MAG: thiamine phosphate synthase [Planctomycetota bacterium]|nr:thiamine phosphate synthase [Planctomycetota bacterium]